MAPGALDKHLPLRINWSHGRLFQRAQVVVSRSRAGFEISLIYRGNAYIHERHLQRIQCRLHICYCCHHTCFLFLTVIVSLKSRSELNNGRAARRHQPSLYISVQLFRRCPFAPGGWRHKQFKVVVVSSRHQEVSSRADKSDGYRADLVAMTEELIREKGVEAWRLGADG